MSSPFWPEAGRTAPTRVALLGSTGSIGTQAVDVLAAHPDRFRVTVLATGRDRTTLDAQAEWLRQYPNVRVTIEGHADERGTREYNLGLGDRRANAARDYLQSRGISPDRMTVISWGKERPQNPASNEEAWAQNRRAVTVVPE